MGDGRIKLDVMGDGRSGRGGRVGGYGSTGGKETSFTKLISTSSNDVTPVRTNIKSSKSSLNLFDKPSLSLLIVDIVKYWKISAAKFL